MLLSYHIGVIQGTDALSWFWVALAAIAWVGFARACRWVIGAAPRGDDDLPASAMFRLIQVYARIVHHLEVEGLEHIPERTPGDARPLLLVANHTAGVDPVLIQAALPFEARWMMAEDMRLARMQWLWDFGHVIFVDRQVQEGKRGDTKGLREALRHLKGGGVLGMFPEGNIERPPRQILPFREGVGMMVAHSGAVVIPVVIEGTPQVEPAWASLSTPSRSRVRFLEPRVYERGGRKNDGRAGPEAISRDLRRSLLEATGWPENPHTPSYKDGRWWYVDVQGRWIPASDFALDNGA